MDRSSKATPASWTPDPGAGPCWTADKPPVRMSRRQGRAQPHVAGDAVQGGRSRKQVVKRWWAGSAVLAEYHTERGLGGLVGA